MTISKSCLLLGIVVAFLGSFTSLHGQAAGGNAVFQGTSKVSSVAFIDASKFGSSSDICTTIQNILAAYAGSAHSGIVIDARGFGSSPPCTGGNPWGAIGSLPPSNTVLLPVGTIMISSTWTLPQNTRLIGQGPNSTIIQASGLTGDMIDMGIAGTACGGASSTDCQGVVIEHLGLNQGAISGVNGIVNQYSQELSYIDDIVLTNFSGGTGLTLIGGNADNSGPYSNIYYSGTGTCVRINGTGGTRGIHGLTCITNSSTSGPLVYLDGSNNSLEDVTLTYASSHSPGAGLDGILVGSQTGYAGAQSNVLMNVTGSNLQSVVHISNQQSTSSICPPGNGSASTYNVCDLTLLGISGGSAGHPTIQDDLPGASGIPINDPTVAMYVVGEQVVQGSTNSLIGYSRLISSPSVLPNWSVGATAPT